MSLGLDYFTSSCLQNNQLCLSPTWPINTAMDNDHRTVENQLSVTKTLVNYQSLVGPIETFPGKLLSLHLPRDLSLFWSFLLLAKAICVICKHYNNLSDIAIKSK